MNEITDLLFSNPDYRHVNLKEIDDFILVSFNSFLKNRKLKNNISPDQTKGSPERSNGFDINEFQEDILSGIRSSVFRKIKNEHSKVHSNPEHSFSIEEFSSSTDVPSCSNVAPSSLNKIEEMKGIKRN